MSRSCRRVSPTCVQRARSILPRPVQRCDCSAREGRQTAFTGTSPAPGCEGSRISDLGSLPSSPEGNYLQETSQASRSTTSPQTSPTAALTLSGLWQAIPFVTGLLSRAAQLRDSDFHLGKKDTVKGGETEIQISIHESSLLLWRAEVTDVSRRRHLVRAPSGCAGPMCPQGAALAAGLGTGWVRR